MLFSLSNSRPPIWIDVLIDGKHLSLELDTGAAAVSVISEATYKAQLNSTPQLKEGNVKLRTYTGEEIPVLGTLEVSVSYDDQKSVVTLLVVKGDGPNLFGRNWLKIFKLHWSRLCKLTKETESLETILSSHSCLFEGGLGTVSGPPVHIHTDTEAKPIFCRPRPIPYALKNKVEKELERLQESKVIKPVEISDWTAPIVPVVKPDGSIRICGDYRVTVNKVAKVDAHPIPRAEDLFASLSGGKSFTKLDVAHAYLQLPLDEESQKMVTINTHKGLFQYQRLPFGISSAPAIFQRKMESILKGIPHVCVYIDDILITGPSSDEHLASLKLVLSKLEEAGMHLKREKCSFLMPSVEYLGHKISAEGILPTDDKVGAIKKEPIPQNVAELRCFFGYDLLLYKIFEEPFNDSGTTQCTAKEGRALDVGETTGRSVQAS
jgi:hypothetical protein